MKENIRLPPTPPRVPPLPVSSVVEVNVGLVEFSPVFVLDGVSEVGLGVGDGVVESEVGLEVDDGVVDSEVGLGVVGVVLVVVGVVVGMVGVVVGVVGVVVGVVLGVV